MDMLVTHLASARATVVDVEGELDLDTSDARASLLDIDQRELSDALMACLLRRSAEDAVMLEKGYRLALERDRLASATR